MVGHVIVFNFRFSHAARFSGNSISYHEEVYMISVEQGRLIEKTSRSVIEIDIFGR